MTDESKYIRVSERWQKINNFANYAISDHGRIMRIAESEGTSKAMTYPGKILKGFKGSRGYLIIRLHKNGKLYRKNIHRLVAHAFLGKCPLGKEVNHKNGNKIDNYIENLEYVTHKENQRKAAKLGLYKGLRGSQSPTAKLTEQDILEIRKLGKRNPSYKEIAKKFSVSKSAIASIILKKNWAWLE